MSNKHAVSVKTETYRVRLIFPVVEIMAVVENVLVCGVEAGFDAVLHHLTRPGGALQLLDLSARKRIQTFSSLSDGHAALELN